MKKFFFLIHPNLITFVCFGVFFVCSSNETFARETIYLPCKKLPQGITLKSIEKDLENYRKGESVFAVEGVLTCKDALPILKKYALDPDKKIRGVVTNALGRAYYDFEKSFYPEPFKLLILQIENFPLEEYSMPVHYASSRPCFYFKLVNAQSLTDVLIKRIKFRNTEFNREEIEILGCLSRREPRAKEFLLEMLKPEFQTKLNAEERNQQREYLTYPLAEAGEAKMEEQVLAEIESAMLKTDEYAIQQNLPSIRSYTNCRIANRFMPFLLDKREIELTVYGNNFQKRRIKARVADLMIMIFTASYGREATGEIVNDYSVHTDAQIEKIYRRINKFAKRKVYTSCS